MNPPIKVILAGWASAILFGAGAIVGTFRYFDSDRIQVRIGPAGIFSRRWSRTTMPWEEIDEVKALNGRGGKSIAIRLSDPSIFPRCSWVRPFDSLSRRLTGHHVHITLVGTDRRFDEAMSAVERFRPGGGQGTVQESIERKAPAVEL